MSYSLDRRRWLRLIAASGLGTLAGCLGGTGADERVSVGADGRLAFDPSVLEIEPETSVEFVWDADGHALVVESQPDGADWEGEPDVQDSGHRHVHVFEVEGRYTYVCDRHENDMVGRIAVRSADGEPKDGRDDVELDRESDDE